MATPDTVTITLILPPNETAALAQFVKRVDYDTVGRFTSTFVFYSGRTEHDTVWSGLCILRVALAEAGFNPR
jgi:hypothetical protein